jgi:hypothetical protein
MCTSQVLYRPLCHRKSIQLIAKNNPKVFQEINSHNHIHKHQIISQEFKNDPFKLNFKAIL